MRDIREKMKPTYLRPEGRSLRSSMMVMKVLSFEEFRKSGRDMPASEFGRLIRDSQWDDEDITFRVYQDSFYIEHVSSGIERETNPSFILTIENRSWISDDILTLEDLEYRLWRYACGSSIAHDIIHDLAVAAEKVSTDASAASAELLNSAAAIIAALCDDAEDAAFDRLLRKAQHWRREVRLLPAATQVRIAPQDVPPT